MPDAINYTTGLSTAWSNVATFIPKLLVFLIILLVGWLIAKVITKAISAVLTRVGFDRVVERGGVKKALASSKYDASDILAKIVYYAIMLFVLSTAFGCPAPAASPGESWAGAPQRVRRPAVLVLAGRGRPSARADPRSGGGWPDERGAGCPGARG